MGFCFNSLLSAKNIRYRVSGLPPFLCSRVVCFHQVIREAPLSNLTRRSRWHLVISSFNYRKLRFLCSGLHYVLPIPVMSFSSMGGGTILVQARDPAKLILGIQEALDEYQYDEAWRLLEQFMEMEGFPRKSVIAKLLASYAQSSDPRWVKKGYELVERVFEQHNQELLLGKEVLIYLSLSSARCGSPVPASVILRRLVAMQQYPRVAAWTAVLAHMSKSSQGAYLAAELVLEIGYLFYDNRVDPGKKVNSPLMAMKPTTFTFSIALAGCLLAGMTRKAEQLLDTMPRVGVKADSTLLIIMAHVYERNGRTEELNRLKRRIEEAHDLTDAQFREYHYCLLSCQLKCGNLDSASRMVLEMIRKAKEARNSLATINFLSSSYKKSENPTPQGSASEDSREVQTMDTGDEFISHEDFLRDRRFTRVETDARRILAALLKRLQEQVDIIVTEHGILQPTVKTYVKLAKSYLEAGRTKDLAEFLIQVEKEDLPISIDDSTLAQVISCCIALGWLDHAHDLLDETRFAGIIPSSSIYSSLLKAYCKENRTIEALPLLREVKKVGVQLDSSCYDMLIESRVLEKDTTGAIDLFKEMKEAKIPRFGQQREFDKHVQGCAESGKMMSVLLNEIKEGQREDRGLHGWNNVIHFFSKKRLMQDAEKALQKMQSLGHTPNAQTFHSLVIGYASIGGKYTEVTVLWGQMKSLATLSGQLKFDQELLDAVLYTFVRGGFFIRANEVVEMMEKGNMFVDKYKYRALFLKYHRTLYKGKVLMSQTETQSKKKEAALAFKRWVGLY